MAFVFLDVCSVHVLILMGFFVFRIGNVVLQ